MGTSCECVARWRSTRASHSSASKRSMTTAVPPRRCVIVVQPAGRGVVERRRAQVDGRLREPVEPDEQPGEGLRLAERAGPQRRLHALGPAGRARRVEHPRALALVVDRLGGHGRDGLGVGLEAGEVAADREAEADAAEVGAHGGHGLRQPGVGDEGPGAAVGDDVAGLGRGQVEVDRGDVEAGAQRAPHDLVPGRTVHEQHGDPVAGRAGRGPAAAGRRGSTRPPARGRSGSRRWCPSRRRACRRARRRGPTGAARPRL